jgi:hypothetical protein
MSYASFQATPSGSNQVYECSFHTLTTGIAPRHSDTVDVKFLVGGHAVVVALPHRAFADFKGSAHRALTDREAVEAAGYLLKSLIERGQWSSEAEYRAEFQEARDAIQQVAMR